MITKFEELLEKAKDLKSQRIVLVAAESFSSMEAVCDAHKKGFVIAVLIGAKDKIKENALKLSWNLDDVEVFDIPDYYEAATKGVELIREKKADFLMKGGLHTDILLKAVLDKEKGLKKSKFLSHVMVVNPPAYHKLLLLTDCAMIIAPDLEQKKAIVENSLEVAHALEIEKPKVAVLGAVEDVNIKMQATLDAACLSKMADRKQIKNAIIDGPLAFDNAISKESAKEKGIESNVAGDADILLAPEIEAGNILFKAITNFANSECAGVIIGAKCPIALTSRADSAQSKLYSIVLASYLSYHQN